MSLGTFTQSYLTTALWSSNDESDEFGGDPMDKNYGPEDIAPDTLKYMKRSCTDFYQAHSDKWDDDSQAGHDFWLTRNGHGAGFWDGDYPEPQAAALTDASHDYGECNLYVGDDSQIHLF